MNIVDKQTYNKLIQINSIDMFNKLESIGCSITNMEKCLTARSVIGFRDSLIGYYPALRESINEKTKKYE